VNAQNHSIGRFADALVALGEACDALPQLERDLAAAADLLRSNERIRRFLADPSVDECGKSLALERILGKRVHPAAVHFLSILRREGRLADLDEVVGVFLGRVGLLGRKVTGELVTARPLSEARVAEIEQEVGRTLGKDVHLIVRINEDLLGGVIVKVGSLVVDGTVAHRLEAVEKALAASDVNQENRGR
jgi:F-type H+-transporting ATPase subunit delta